MDEMVEFFNSNLVYLYNIHAPVKTSRFTKKPAPWLTDNLRLMMKLRNKALLKYKKLKSDIALAEYKDLRNFVSMAVKNEKKAYLNHKFRTDPGGFWKTVKHLNINNNSSQCCKSSYSPSELNTYFVEGIPAVDASHDVIFEKYFGKRHDNSGNFFEFTRVDESLVDKIISNIKSNARGTDEIDIKMLLYISPYLTSHITYIVNKCLESSTFPKAWKNSNVIPVPKVANPEEYAQFRPISILPTISKILERIVHNQVSEYVKTNNILPSTQSGFRPNHGTSTALLHVTDDIYRACDSGRGTVLVLLDYSKAFDTLDHNTLCSKLKYFGFCDEAVIFFQNYLSGRQQRVCVGSAVSDFLPVSRGVPQGSILGPLLFSIYTADFSTYLNTCLSHQYADDFQIYHSFYSLNVESAITNINKDLQNIADISKAHSLLLNSSKSKLLLFGKVDQRLLDNNLKISIDGSQLTLSNQCRNLGLILDTNMRFESHVSELVQKAYYKLKVLYMHKDHLSTDIKLRLCDTLILSVLSYCNVVYWPALTNREKNSLQKIQNSCLKFCYNQRKFDHVSPLFEASGWLKLNERFVLQMATLTHKILLNNSPEYLYSKLTPGTSIHSRLTRNCQRLTIPKHRSAQFQRCFSYNAVRIYNSIETKLKALTSLETFKKSVKKSLK